MYNGNISYLHDTPLYFVLSSNMFFALAPVPVYENKYTTQQFKNAESLFFCLKRGNNYVIALTVTESPSAATTLMSAGLSLWTRIFKGLKGYSKFVLKYKYCYIG